MLDLARVATRGQADQHTLPTPYRALQQHRFAFRFGQLGMIVGGPGAGKSAVALDWVTKARCPTLYVSPDTDPWTMSVRGIAKATGFSQDYVETVVASRGAGEFTEKLEERLGHIRFSFDAYDMKDIENDVEAYRVVFGEYPHVIVVDNLRNVARGGDSDLSAQREVLDGCHLMAAVTGAAVIVLAHATGDYHNGDKQIPLSGIENKLSALPAQILSLHRNGDAVYLCVLKNRQAKMDPSGNLQGGIRADLERQSLEDWR